MCRQVIFIILITGLRVHQDQKQGTLATLKHPGKCSWLSYV